MFTPATSKHFTSYTDPESGITSYVLSTKVAPFQQSFYVTNPSMTEDCRYLWFWCAYPPAGTAAQGRCLGLLDFETDEISVFHDTYFVDASPMVDPKTGECYFTNEFSVFKKAPGKDTPLEKLFDIPEKYRNGVCERVATHLTFSADHKKLGLDMCYGSHWYIGTLDLETKTFEEWIRPNYHINHMQMNPVDNDLCMCAEDFFTDPSSGIHYMIRTNDQGQYLRLKTLRRGDEDFKQWYVLGLQKATHEWWSKDGRHFNYCRYATGVDNDFNAIVRCNIETGEQEVMVDCQVWHGSSDKDDSLYVFDANLGYPFYRGAASRVGCAIPKTGKIKYIISLNPALYTREDQCRYHMDPHPHFTAGDRYVCFTTTVRNQVDVALTPVENIKKALAE